MTRIAGTAGARGITSAAGWLAASLATAVCTGLRPGFAVRPGRLAVTRAAWLHAAHAGGAFRTARFPWFSIVVGLCSARLFTRIVPPLPGIAGLLILGLPGPGLLRPYALPAAFDAAAPAAGVLFVSLALLLRRTLPRRCLIALGWCRTVGATRAGLRCSPACGGLTGQTSSGAATLRRIGFQQSLQVAEFG